MDWIEHRKALERKFKEKTKIDQLVGSDLFFWAEFYEKNYDKLRSMAESVMLDLRYKRNLDKDSDLLLREGVESMISVMAACNSEVKKQRDKKEIKEESDLPIKINI